MKMDFGQTRGRRKSGICIGYRVTGSAVLTTVGRITSQIKWSSNVPDCSHQSALPACFIGTSRYAKVFEFDDYLYLSDDLDINRRQTWGVAWLGNALRPTNDIDPANIDLSDRRLYGLRPWTIVIKTTTGEVCVCIPVIKIRYVLNIVTHYRCCDRICRFDCHIECHATRCLATDFSQRTYK